MPFPLAKICANELWLPALADTAKVMAYSDGPFQDNYTQTVLDPYNKAGGPNRIEAKTPWNLGPRSKSSKVRQMSEWVVSLAGFPSVGIQASPDSHAPFPD